MPRVRNTMRALFIVTLFIALSVACSRQTPDAPPPAAVGPKQVSEAFLTAYNAKDAVKIASLYADDAELMPPDSQPLKGRAAIEALFREKFEQKCVMELSSIRSDVSGGHAFDTGTMSVTMPAENGSSQKVSGNYLAVFKRVGDEWKIAYHMQTIVPTQ